LIPCEKAPKPVTPLNFAMTSHNTSYQPHIRARTPLTIHEIRLRKYAPRT
jgi:hypothetical protein